MKRAARTAIIGVAISLLACAHAGGQTPPIPGEAPARGVRSPLQPTPKGITPRPQAPINGPALSWRFLSGDGVDGVLRLSDEQTKEVGAPVGYFVLQVRGEGFFEGVYNIREDGESAVGVFWPEEAGLTGEIAGMIDLGAAPDGELGRGRARVMFISGGVLDGLKVE